MDYDYFCFNPDIIVKSVNSLCTFNLTKQVESIIDEEIIHKTKTNHIHHRITSNKTVYTTITTLFDVKRYMNEKLHGISQYYNSSGFCNRKEWYNNGMCIKVVETRSNDTKITYYHPESKMRYGVLIVKTGLTIKKQIVFDTIRKTIEVRIFDNKGTEKSCHRYNGDIYFDRMIKL